jgi:hypothetical protein
MLKQNIARQDLRDAFTVVADRRGILPMVVEKDFWITWCLGKLFSANLPVSMVFKGGTSLSKLLDELKLVCNEFVTTTIRSALADSMEEELQDEIWDIRPDKDPQSLRFYYPRVLNENSYGDQEYIRRSVLLEFGVRGDIYPTEDVAIKSYVAEEFDTFVEDAVTIPCLSPKRTFWEKATLLHAEYYRPVEKATPERTSRHIYDVSMLYRAGYADKAIQDMARSNCKCII